MPTSSKVRLLACPLKATSITLSRDIVVTILFPFSSSFNLRLLRVFEILPVCIFFKGFLIKDATPWCSSYHYCKILFNTI